MDYAKRELRKKSINALKMQELMIILNQLLNEIASNLSGTICNHIG
jgi:hypothetical protein